MGYSLIELLMVIALISVLGSIFLRSQSSSFANYSKVRLAAAELSGAIAKARDTAAKNIPVDLTCNIVQTIDKVSTNVTTAVSPANCISTTLLPNSISLRARSGSSSLSIDQTTVFTFRADGMSTNADALLTDQTILLSDPRSTATICVNLTIPTAIIRLGLSKSGSKTCDYTAK
ncbi:MAG: prepilin-type N-terminal cleavage/methylation domain-containing protein [Cyanobacteria bacterium]|nr:prepilin-type N-terminal cleavage/methylation domain-containing protein [Cyanobacteriota bacterium]